MAHPASILTLMKRAIAIRLDAANLQSKKLAALQSTFAAACNVVAPLALEHRCTNRVKLHHLVYYAVRERFPGLGAQMACNAIARIAHGLKAHRANGREWAAIAFRANTAVHFDARTFRLGQHCVSLFTMEGRERVAMRLGSFQRAYLKRGEVKEADLLVRRGVWYLHVVLDVPESDASIGSDVLGVDLGENVTAATSGGTLNGGGALRDKRDRFLALCARLQRNGSQSAKQLLARVSGRESRHVRHVNHEISANIVAEAAGSGCRMVVLENLTNIRSRIKTGKGCERGCTAGPGGSCRPLSSIRLWPWESSCATSIRPTRRRPVRFAVSSANGRGIGSPARRVVSSRTVTAMRLAILRRLERRLLLQRAT